MTNLSNISLIGKIKTKLSVTDTETPYGVRKLGTFTVTVSRTVKLDGNAATVNNDYIIETFSERTIAEVEKLDVESFIAVVGQFHLEDLELRVAAERAVPITGTAACFARISAWGRVTKTPELRSIGSDHSVTNINVAVNHGPEWTTYLGVEVWDKQAEIMCESLVTGNPVLVTDDISPRHYQNKHDEPALAVNIVNARIGFTGKKNKPATVSDGGAPDGFTPVDHPEDLPF